MSPDNTIREEDPTDMKNIINSIRKLSILKQSVNYASPPKLPATIHKSQNRNARSSRKASWNLSSKKLLSFNNAKVADDNFSMSKQDIDSSSPKSSFKKLRYQNTNPITLNAF